MSNQTLTVKDPTANPAPLGLLAFGMTTVLFFLLAVGDATGNALLKTIAGYEGILCGFSAIYAAMAQVLNEVYGKTVLPLG